MSNISDSLFHFTGKHNENPLETLLSIIKYGFKISNSSEVRFSVFNHAEAIKIPRQNKNNETRFEPIELENKI